MKKSIKATPAEVMLIELAIGEYNEAVESARIERDRRMAAIAASHPEAKNFGLEHKDGDTFLTYDDGLEPPVPPVS